MEPEESDVGASPPRQPIAEKVALTLAIGLSASLVIMAGTIGFAVVTGQLPSGLGENATQVLTGWGGGIVGVLGSFVGYVYGARHCGPN